jgi:hypothetical protein
VKSSSRILDVSTTTNPLTQPALIGGLVMGVLSALPLVAAGNLCCCLWVLSGGLVAAYVLQQKQPTPITQGDGALVGLLAGIVGALVYLVVSIPIALLVAPMEREVLQRLLESSGRMPPEFRDFVGSRAAHGVRLVIGFVFMLLVGTIFSTLGGLIGAVLFRKPLPPAATDAAPPSSSVPT